MLLFKLRLSTTAISLRLCSSRSRGGRWTLCGRASVASVVNNWLSSDGNVLGKRDVCMISYTSIGTHKELIDVFECRKRVVKFQFLATSNLQHVFLLRLDHSVRLSWQNSSYLAQWTCVTWSVSFADFVFLFGGRTSLSIVSPLTLFFVWFFHPEVISLADVDRAVGWREVGRNDSRRRRTGYLIVVNLASQLLLSPVRTWLRNRAQYLQRNSTRIRIIHERIIQRKLNTSLINGEKLLRVLVLSLECRSILLGTGNHMRILIGMTGMGEIDHCNLMRILQFFLSSPKFMCGQWRWQRYEKQMYCFLYSPGLWVPSFLIFVIQFRK